MNETEPLIEQDEFVEIVAIVTSGLDGGVLISRDGDNGGLPHLRLSRSDFRSASPLNKGMEEKFGLTTTVLSPLFQRMSEGRQLDLRAYSFEQHAGGVRPDGSDWVLVDEVNDVALSSQIDRQARDAWLAGQNSEAAQRCPWGVPGWWDEAVHWIDEELGRLDITRTGSPVQLRAWSLSAIIRIPTSVGQVFFKAVPAFMSHEGAAMAALSEAHPSMVPPPLAADGPRGWLLMPDFRGNFLGKVPDVGRWEEAVNIHARMQLEQSGRARSWLDLGCPDRSLGRMVDLVDPLITVSAGMLAGRPDGLSGEEIEALLGLSMRLKFMCAQLADFNIPHSLVHGDLGGNILVKDDGGFVFFDWTDACISHPFFDMATLANTFFDDNAFQGDEAVGLRLRDAYLKPWSQHQPMERLIQAYEAARPLGALHQAMTYMWILTNIAEDARWQLEGGLRQWLKIVLTLCGG